MKYKKTLAIAASFIGASLLSSATFAGSIDNFNVITDPDAATQTSSGYQYTSTFSFEHNQAHQAQKTSVGIDNPDTFDAMPLVLGISIACVVFAFAMIFAKSRRRGHIGKGFFAFVLGVAILSGFLGGTSYAAPDDDEEDGVKTFAITDAGIYRAIRNCATGDYEGTRLSGGSGTGGNPGTKGVSHIHNNTCYYDAPEILFDDATQLVTMDPELLDIIDLSGLGVRSLAELTQFSSLGTIYAQNNHISDISMITRENFPWLESIDLAYNNIESIGDMNLEPLFSVDTLFTQSFELKVDENGNAKIPALLSELAGLFEMGSGEGQEVKMPIHVYNLTLSNDLSTMQIVDPSKDAYAAISLEEVMAAIQDTNPSPAPEQPIAH